MRGKSKYLFALSLLTIAFSVTAFAQTESGYNKEVRTNTWSIYTQGGVSWASGVWYDNIDAKTSYKLSPAVGGGIDYNIRPWVRVGAEYMYSRYRREQRFATIDPNAVPAKTYGNYLMNYHNAKLGAGFNIMEIWPNRGCQWLNIYAGTGVGYMFAKGNEYGIYFSTTMTKDGVTTPVIGTVDIDNSSTVSFAGNVKTTNTHGEFNRFYIPASLHVEADICRQVAVGIKGESDWLLNRKEIAPKSLIFALATVRYTFGTGRKPAPVVETCCGEVEAMNARIRDLASQLDESNARSSAAESDNERLREENADLQRRLEECEAAAEKVCHVVHFDNDSDVVGAEEEAALRAFAQSVVGQQVSILAEASTPGGKNHNQALSERRLQSVVKILNAEGIGLRDIYPAFAVGSQNGIETAEGRRVTITVE